MADFGFNNKTIGQYNTSMTVPLKTKLKVSKNLQPIENESNKDLSLPPPGYEK